MKKIVFLFLLAIIAINSSAQVQEIGVSKHFETLYPEEVKLISLSNDQTMLIRLHDFNKLNVHIYDENYTEIVHFNSKLPIKDVKKSSLFGIRETKEGNVSFYILVPELGSDRVLFLVTLNGKTGEILACDELQRASRKPYGMWVSFTQGSSYDFKYSENKEYSVLYFKNYDAETPQMKQEIWVMDQSGAVIEKTGINLDKDNKYPKGIGLIGFDITNEGTVYAITTNYKNEKDMKRNLIKKELNKPAQSFRLCGMSDKSDFDWGKLKYNAVNKEVVFVNSKNFVFKFDENGNCKKELLSFRELKKVESAYIKTKKTDKFLYHVFDVNVEKDGSYSYTIALNLERLESHHNFQNMPYSYLAGYAIWNEQHAILSFLPTFVRGSVSYSSASDEFRQLREDDTKTFTVFDNKKEKYFLFNDNEDSRSNLEEDKNLKRIQKKSSLEGFYAKAIYDGLPVSAPIENTSKGTTFYYFGTAHLNKKGELVVIKILNGDKMQVSWLKIKE